MVVFVLAVALVLVLVVPMVLTGVGSRSRGNSIAVATASGLFFPITWAVWYLRDEHPYAQQPADQAAPRC